MTPQRTGYEKSDARPKWIFGVVAFLFVSGLLLHFGTARIMRWLEKSAEPKADFRSFANTTPGLKPVPHLQLQPAEDLKEFRAREQSQLNTYARIDRAGGVVRIPVDRAMELVLERGLPFQAGTNQQRPGPSNYELQQQRLENLQQSIPAQK
jgi:hypothetical protein